MRATTAATLVLMLLNARRASLLVLATFALGVLPSCEAMETSATAQETRPERAQAKQVALPESAPSTASDSADAPAPSFAGVWNVKWCEQFASSPAPCGGFYAYLTQTGSRICGNHFGSDERMNRMDEGKAKSIMGTVVGSTAVLTVTSGRNDAIYLVRAEREGNTLAWQIVGTVREGSDGEPSFIADKELLSRNQGKENLEVLGNVKAACAASSPAAP